MLWDSDEALLWLAHELHRDKRGRVLPTEPGSIRGLQGGPPSYPNYTSPALPDAIAATPEPFRDDGVVQQARDAARAGTCNATAHQCMIPFAPPPGAFEEESPTIGVVLYGGGLVDPRSYSVLASRLANRYGFAVFIPIFASDVPFVPCESGRPQVAARLLPSVQKWIIMGHSFGGTAAVADLWAIASGASGTANASSASAGTVPPTLDQISGLVLLASYVSPIAGCAADIDFSAARIPVALVTASNDHIMNRTRWEEGRALVPENGTLYLDVLGGNHGGFGSYDASGRVPVLGPAQQDGPMLIDPAVQWDLSVAAAANVASLSGADLPPPAASPSPPTSGSSMLLSYPFSSPAIEPLLLLVLIFKLLM
jgi:hypothetical protein